MCFHAHPDDEVFGTGGVMRMAADAGHRVVLVVATDGAAGQVPDGLLRPGESLSARRRDEVEASAAVLGADRVVFLGYGDSGMAGEPTPASTNPFRLADVDEATGRLARVLDEEQPDVLTVYDANGGYGHPDHIQAHRLTMAALEAAAVGADAWQTPKVYQTVAEEDSLAAGLADMGEVPAGWAVPAAGDLPAHPAAAVTTEIDIAPVLGRKVRALAAHATQVAVAPGGRSFTLSNLVAQPILDREHFILVRGQLGRRNAAGLETDLFDGLDVGA